MPSWGGTGSRASRRVLTTLTLVAGVLTLLPAAPAPAAEPVLLPDLVPASLSIDKAVDRPRAASGETVTYTLTVRNAGLGVARDVVVSDALPDGTTYAGVSTDTGSCSRAGAVVTCDLGEVAAGTTRVVTVTATVDPVAASGTRSQHQLRTTDVETRLTAPAASSATATAACPSGYVAVDGSVRVDAVDAGALGDVVVEASTATADGTAWTGTVRNPTTGPARAAVVVVCTSAVSTSDAGHTHDLVLSAPVTVTGTRTAGSWPAELACGAGQVAVAPGFQITAGTARVRSSVRDGTGWRFVADVADTATGTFAIRCLSTTLSAAAGHTHDLGLTQVVGTADVPAGQTAQTSLTCDDGANGLVASYDGVAGLVPLGTDPQAGTRLFRSTNPTAAALTTRVGLLCLETRTDAAVGDGSITNTASVATSSPDATTADDTSSATFRPVPAPGPTAVPFSVAAATVQVLGSGPRVRLAVPLRSSVSQRLTVRVLALRAVPGTSLRRGDALATRVQTVRSGRRTVALRLRGRVARAVSAGRVDRVRVVVVGRDGRRVVRAVRLR